MNIKELIESKNLTMHKLSVLSHVPYMTINNLCSGHTNVLKCNLETVYRIAMVLNIPIEELLPEQFKNTHNFSKEEIKLYLSEIAAEYSKVGSKTPADIIIQDEAADLLSGRTESEIMSIKIFINYAASHINNSIMMVQKKYNLPENWITISYSIDEEEKNKAIHYKTYFNTIRFRLMI